MPANKPRSKKSWHISGQGNIQITRITGRGSSGRNELGRQAGAKAGMNQPVVHPLDGTRKGRDPAWLEVTLPPGPLRSAIQCCAEKKNLRPGNMNRSPHQSRDYEPAGAGVPPSIPFVAMPGPLNRLVHTTLPITPALGAFIGPKQYNAMVVLKMASTAGTCHWVSTAPDGIGTTDVALSSHPRCLPR